nr:glycerophosphodiester phosphodiesterase [Alteromonas sp. ASW11-130]
MSFNCLAFDIIAHRGASGYLPEHTLEATTLAHTQHPSYIEQDVVLTKDDIPIVLHDIYLDNVTNVAQKFPERARADNRYYVIDFTLKEIRSLSVHERKNAHGKQVFPDRYQGSHAHFTVATLAEHLELIAQLNHQTQRSIGIYPEIKAPAWHRQQGKDISAITLSVLNDFGYLNNASAIILQCFDFNEIKRIREELGFEGKLVQLIGAQNLAILGSAQSIKSLAEIADGVGPSFYQLLDKDALSQGNIKPQDWIIQAKRNGLLIHPYTLRADQLPSGMSLEQVTTILSKLQVDGVFTDHVPLVKAALESTAK